MPIDPTLLSIQRARTDTPDEALLPALLDRLLLLAQQRPDLLSESRGGPSFGSPGYRPTGEQAVATFAGRMVRPGDTLESVLSRFPQAEAETGGLSMQAHELLRAAIPVALWRSMSPEAKAMVTRYANRYPENFRRVLNEPRQLTAEVSKSTDVGSRGSIGPSQDVPDLDIIRISPGAVKSTTPAHEIQHFLNDPRVRATDPADAGTIGRLLSDFIPKEGAGDDSLGYALGKLGVLQDQLGLTGLSGPLRELAKKPELFDQAQKRLAELPRSKGIYGVGTELDQLNRLAMDEALAYLAQHSAGRSRRSKLTAQQQFDATTRKLDLAIQRLQEAEVLRNRGEKPPIYRTEKLFAGDPEVLRALAEKLGVLPK